jgi:hypothetical protein
LPHLKVYDIKFTLDSSSQNLDLNPRRAVPVRVSIHPTITIATCSQIETTFSPANPKDFPMRHPPRLELQKRATFGPCSPAVGSLLLLASLLAVLSLVFRAYYSGRETYFFLFKDLFLAWVPMALSLALVWLAHRDSRGVSGIIVLVGTSASISVVVGGVMVTLPSGFARRSPD